MPFYRYYTQQPGVFVARGGGGEMCECERADAEVEMNAPDINAYEFEMNLDLYESMEKFG